MLLGLGVDILSLARLEAVIARRGADKLAARICSPRELAEFRARFVGSSTPDTGARSVPISTPQATSSVSPSPASQQLKTSTASLSRPQPPSQALNDQSPAQDPHQRKAQTSLAAQVNFLAAR